MDSIVEAFGRYFERFIRWIYPGMLFLLLLHLGRPDLLRQLRLGEDGIFGFIILIVVFSFIIYSIHRHVLHEIYLLVLYLKGYSATAKMFKKEYGQQRWYKRLLKYFESEKKFLVERFKEKTDFSDYLINRWAVTHAMGVTGWVLLLMYKFASENSCLEDLGVWVLSILILSLIGYGYQSLVLTEVETKFIETK